mgnify:FL=1
MIKISPFFSTFFAIFILGCSNAKYKGNNVIIDFCYDVDACVSVDKESIRLACIDDIFNLKSMKGEESRIYINNLIAGEELTIKRLAYDKYGRTVANLYKDQINIQDILVNKNIAASTERHTLSKKKSFSCKKN